METSRYHEIGGLGFSSVSCHAKLQSILCFSQCLRKVKWSPNERKPGIKSTRTENTSILSIVMKVLVLETWYRKSGGIFPSNREILHRRVYRSSLEARPLKYGCVCDGTLLGRALIKGYLPKISNVQGNFLSYHSV